MLSYLENHSLGLLRTPPFSVSLDSISSQDLIKVQTSGNDPVNIADLELPSHSHSRRITAVIDRHKKTMVHPNKQNVDIAAKNIVEDVLSGGGIFIRRGQASTLSWLCNTFLPYRLFTLMINQDSALDEIGLGEDNVILRVKLFYN